MKKKEKKKNKKSSVECTYLFCCLCGSFSG